MEWKSVRESFLPIFRHGPIENENIVYTAMQMLSADMVSMSNGMLCVVCAQYEKNVNGLREIRESMGSSEWILDKEE